jgi:predicted methyltransferase
MKTAIVLLLALAAGCTHEAPVTNNPQTSAARPLDAATDAKLRAAIGGAQRTDRERARDVYRHPAETLAFFGLRDDMNVVELWPGGGWYTTLLAPVLAERGKLTVTHFDPNGPPKSEDTEEAKAILARLDGAPDVFGKVARQQIAPGAFVFGADASADMVLTFRNVHNWIDEGNADKVFAAAFKVLKSGGVFGVVDHRGRSGMPLKEIKDSGYVPEDVVIDLAKNAGFKLDARSDVNANPKDTKDYKNGVWALPPAFANKDVDREKYKAIGESDRMTLRFIKP